MGLQIDLQQKMMHAALPHPLPARTAVFCVVCCFQSGRCLYLYLFVMIAMLNQSFFTGIYCTAHFSVLLVLNVSCCVLICC